jgi:serine/threonine-protein kinase
MVASNLSDRVRAFFSRSSNFQSQVKNVANEEEYILWCCRVAMLEQKVDRKLFKPLLKGLSYQDWFVRYRAASALGRLGDSRAIAALQVLQHDPEMLVRDAASEAIALIRYSQRN